MARKKRTASAAPAKSATVATTALSFSELHARLEYLKQEQEKLLKQIKRKKTELSNFTEQLQSIAREMLHQGQPLYEQARQLDSEIHTLFKEILTKRHLGKRAKQQVEQIYQMLQIMGRISPRLDDSFESTMNQEEFDNDMPEFDPDAESEEFGEEDFFGRQYQSRQSGEYSFEPDETTASRPSRDIRKLFLKLADRFHPDRVSDKETREHYTEIMKEINIAYKSGDLARLLEIERQSNTEVEQVDLSQNDQERACQQVEIEIKLLTEQYEQLKAQLRQVRNTPAGQIVKQYRQAKRAGEDLIETSVEDGKAEIKGLEEIRNFARDFRDKKITLDQFLQGPVSGNQNSQEELEELLDELFDNFFVVMNI